MVAVSCPLIRSPDANSRKDSCAGMCMMTRGGQASGAWDTSLWDTSSWVVTVSPGPRDRDQWHLQSSQSALLPIWLLPAPVSQA